MDLSLKGKFAVVGGASQGIGYAIAQLLASEGAAVAMVARHRDVLEESAARIRADSGAHVLPICADIRKAEDCARIIDETSASFGQIDILVNNDGAPPLGELQQFDDEAWRLAVDRNLMSVVRLSRAAAAPMQRLGWGRIINITALSVLQPLPRFGLSVATWAGVLGYAKTLSLELAAHGITVNTVCPGRIETGRLQTVFGSGKQGAPGEDMLAQMAKEIPVGRVGEPREIAGLVAFLASDWAGYITGCAFHVDGGRRASLI